MIRLSVILLLHFLISGISAQKDFVSMDKRYMTSEYIGKMLTYGSRHSSIEDTSYQSIEISSKALQENNVNVIIDALNNNPHIIYLKLSRSGLFNFKDTTKVEVPPLRKLKHIQYLEIYGDKLNCNYEQLFDEMNKMPSLEYLLLLNYNLKEVDFTTNFKKILERLKGISFMSEPIELPVCENNISELVIKQKQSILINNLSKLNPTKLTDLSIAVDTLGVELCNRLSEFKNLRQFKLTAKHIEKEVSIVQSLKKLVFLQKLSLSSIPQTDFDNLSELKHITDLDIQIDSIQSRDIKQIFALSKLEKLVLKTTNADTLEWAESNCKTLKHLNVYGKLKYLSEKVTDFEKLESLELTFNQLVSLPNNIGKLRALRVLDVKYNNLESIPESLDQLINLEHLLLVSNKIQQLPKRIGNLSQLKEINISNNELRSMPASIGKCIRLVNLDCHNNFIEQIPESIYDLAALETLLLYNNKITHLPKGISKLVALKQLYLHNRSNTSSKNSPTEASKENNNILAVPEDLAQLHNLEFLNLSENTMLGNKAIEVLMQFRNPSTKILLENCGIDKLPKKGWANVQLKELNLLKNNISVVPDELFQTQIAELDLRKNPLGLLDTRFTDNTNLKLYGYLIGVIEKEELFKCRNLLEVIMDVAARGYYYGRKNPILDIYPLAFELDPEKAAELIDHENYADALFEIEAYEQCIPHYTESINKDLAGCMRVVNFILPKIYNRHTAYLHTRDTISAIHDLQYIEDLFGYNMSAEAAMLYLKMGNRAEYTALLDKSIQHYLGLKNPTMGDQLGLLELYVINGNDAAFDTLSTALLKEVEEQNSNDYILDYLILIRELKQYEQKEVNSYIEKLLFSNYENKSWNCGLIETWATELSEPMRSKIKSLNAVLCPEK